MTDETGYLVAGSRPWNRRSYQWLARNIPGRWSFVSDPEELTREMVERFDPRYIFFLHWSWIVPAAIHEVRECVVFHMTDVPFGRGGSPLQNLIVRGHRMTRLSALRMVEALDAGPVYMKENLSLEGSAEEILTRASDLSVRMAAHIIRNKPAPVPQEGEPVFFKRRGPGDSRIPGTSDIAMLYDFVRMLDADGYPAAFLEHQGYRYEFTRAAIRDDRIEARVTIRRMEEGA